MVEWSKALNFLKIDKSFPGLNWTKKKIIFHLHIYNIRYSLESLGEDSRDKARAKASQDKKVEDAVEMRRAAGGKRGKPEERGWSHPSPAAKNHKGERYFWDP